VESIISELEIRLGLAEDHLDTLNRTIFRQQEQINLLQAQIRELARSARSAELAEAEPRNPADEVPPHY
jgi:SlyX protein